MKSIHVTVPEDGNAKMFDGELRIWVGTIIDDAGVIVGSTGSENTEDDLRPGDFLRHTTVNGQVFEVRCEEIIHDPCSVVLSVSRLKQ
jgi:hypothetical protein